jgi:hypothetical protein
MSILTNYRPNFCCECGHKIVRLRWFVWTSRRFCDKCSRAFARSHWLRPSLSLVALLLFGVLVGRGCRRAPTPLVIERPTPAQNSTAGTAVTSTNSELQQLTDQSASTSDCRRNGLHLRRAHKERHPVLPPRTWTSTLLATQRRPGNAAVGEAAS